MPMIRSKYPANWEAISLTVRAESGWRCEWCGAVHGQPHPLTGSIVVLTVHHKGAAHADGRPGDPDDKMDNRRENLAALCQRCHLKAEQDIRRAKRRATQLSLEA